MAQSMTGTVTRKAQSRPTQAAIANKLKVNNLARMLREQGSSGTKNFNGVLNDEYLPALSMYQAPAIYDRMRRSDGTVAALVAANIMPIRSAKWYIQPYDDSPASLEMADFMHDNLWNFGQQTFDSFLSEALTFLPFGFSWFEKIFDWVDMPEWQGKLGWSKFAFRYQNSRWRWNTPLVSGPGGVMHRKLVSVSQFAPPDYKIVDIPVEKLLIFSNDKEGDNFDGISLLRSVYKHWLIKDALYKIQGIGLERASVGVPYVKLAGPVDDDTYAYLLSIIENMRVDDQAGVMYDGNEAEIGYLDGKFNAQAVSMAIDHHDNQIMKAGLAQFVNLGTRSSGTTGSYALSQDQSQMFLDVLNGKANVIASDFHLQATIQLLEWNFPQYSRQQLPRLSHGDIGERAISKLAVALNAFAQYGFITPDPRTENVIRELIDFPERDEDYHEEQAMIPLLTSIGDEPGVAAPKKGQQATQPKAPTQQQPQAGNGGSANGTGSMMARKKVGSPKNLRTKGLTGSQMGSKSMAELSERDKHRLYDDFMGDLESMKRSSLSWEPERPSHAAARQRRPYEIQG